MVTYLQSSMVLRWFLALSIGIGVALGAGRAFSADGPELVLTGSLDKKRYALGEPVYFTVVLRNASDQPQMVAPDLTPQDGSIEIAIEDMKGKTSVFVPTSVLDSDAPAATLPPARVKANVVAVFFGARGWTFDSPGRYTIKAAYVHREAGKSARVAAAPVTLEVVDDAGGKLLVQKSKRPSQEAGQFLLWMSGDHLRGGIALLEELLMKHPQSQVANYAALALGRSLARHFQDYGAEAVRLPDYGKAQFYLQRVKPAELPVYLRAQFDLTQALVNAGLGRKEPARIHLNNAKKAIGEREELSKLADAASRTERTIERQASHGPAQK